MDKNQINKWTLILGRIPLYEEGTVESMRIGRSLYKVTGVLLNGKELRCQAARLVMKAASAAVLHLEIAPRDLEIVNESERVSTTAECEAKFAGDARLTVRWSGPNVPKLEDALRELLAKYGLECWAQGYNFKTNERDMAFRPIQENEEHTGA